MATLRPLRQINENDVVNLFALDEDAVKGTIVKLDTSVGAHGWRSDDSLTPVSINNNYPNTVSDHWKVLAKVVKCGAGDSAFGMLLHDVKDTDENGESLLFHPRKAHEMQVSLKGHPVPVLTKGIVMVNGVTNGGGVLAIAPGVKVFTAASGGITTHATNDMAAGYLGVCLGQEDASHNVLIKFEPHNV